MKQTIKKYLPNRIKKYIRQKILPKENSNEKLVKRIMAGKNISQSNQPSCLFFTTHKCASTYMGKFMPYLNANYLGLTSIDIENYLWNNTTQDVHQKLQENQSTFFRTNGILYSPLRAFISIDNIEKYHIILMLRDPRDVLVSNYYSLAYSHQLPKNQNRSKNFLNKRIEVQNKTIDEFVISRTNRFYNVYNDYCNKIIDNKLNFCLLKYETFWYNFDFFLNEIERYFAIQINPKDKQFLREMKGSNNSKENRYDHKRKGVPGDHKNKLSQNTQDFLNEKFSRILYTLGYEI